MHTAKTKKPDNQKAKSASVKKQFTETSASSFTDHRPEAIAQRKLQEGTGENSRIKQLRAIQEVSETGSKTKQAAQLQAMVTQHAQQKTVQRTQARSETVQKQSETQAKNTTGLPDTLKSGVENLSGYSMDDVKVHYNSHKPAQLNAHAYAQGTDIHLASGQEKHLPHEAWHVVQQKQGRVKPTKQMKGKVNINDDAGLEKEADVMGARASAAGTDTVLNYDAERSNSQYASNTLQRLVITSEEIEEVDSVIAADIEFQHDKAGGEIILFEDLISEDANTYTIDDGEGIILSGHGEPGKVSGIDAATLARYIGKIGNYEKAKYIYIASCDAATPDEKTGKSVVDVTNEILNASADKGKAVPIYGATGIAVNDFDFLTKDFQTRYKKDFEGVAILIEDLVTEAAYPGVKDALEKKDIEAVVKTGKDLLISEKFRSFYKLLIRALSGKLTLTEAIKLTSDLGKEIDKKGILLKRIGTELDEVGNSLKSSKLTATDLSEIGETLDHLSQGLDYVSNFIKDARGLLDFIERRYLKNEDISTISRTDKGEFALEGYDKDQNKGGMKYKDL